jgi:hypothetical protein
MKGIPQGRYNQELRQEAVKLVIEQKLSWAKAAAVFARIYLGQLGQGLSGRQTGRDREELSFPDGN